MIFRLCKIGLPIGANSAAYALVYWALLRVAISPLGPEVNAALGIGFSALEGFTWPLFHGISLGVATLVGQQLGAGRPDEAQRAARLGFWPVTFAGLLAAGAFGFLARPLCGFFTGPGPVLEQAVIYAQVLAFSQVMVAWESLAEGVLQGSGDTRTVFRWSFPLNALRVPLCWALAGPLGLGAAGVWWGINLTTWVKAAGKGRAALRGDWTRVQI
jgi:MATE family multidrug resistance protein